ncbi:metallophosphoesterase [Paucibacter sp. R3-3]|uniref:Metallophosphoesterase n=1 Tax=Roseateles agri TaxID=3098619 RepID=A0ABU5DQY5_9BURK|nr:metallophosphoesterase [Paucibacter sp. R3-3]MDY0748733.1 metallophosphoesterase [Paucibacter sp. R3-3]
MRLLILSDLHLEFRTEPESGERYDYQVPADLDFDVAILAGDIQAPGALGVQWAADPMAFSGRPVIYVPGNHEFYGHVLELQLNAMSREGKDGPVRVLHRSVAVIGGVRFFGVTLWTDFSLPVEADGQWDTDINSSLAAANRDLNDYARIRVMETIDTESRRRDLKRPLKAEDTLVRHWKDRDWLRRELKQPFEGPTVVVTHHAPSSASLPPSRAGDRLPPAYVTHLPDEFFDVPALWIHGHTHVPADYKRGACRIVSNPRGHFLEDGTPENPQFDPGFVIEVPPHVGLRAGEAEG